MSKQKLSENILTFLPLLHKKLTRKGYPVLEITRQQFELLFNIACNSGRPMKYYGERLMISKPNLTGTVDKLIELGYISRKHDKTDRRVIILDVTKDGLEYLEVQKIKIKKEMEKKFEVLSDKEIERLNEIFEEMKIIFSKMVDQQD